MSKNDRSEDLSFHVQLLLNLEGVDQFPFTKMVVEQRLSEKEYHDTIQLVDHLYRLYIDEVEEGLLNYRHLLIHFAGMLTPKLPVDQTIIAMYEEGIYQDLTGLFINWTSGHYT